MLTPPQLWDLKTPMCITREQCIALKYLFVHFEIKPRQMTFQMLKEYKKIAGDEYIGFNNAT